MNKKIEIIKECEKCLAMMVCRLLVENKSKPLGTELKNIFSLAHKAIRLRGAK